MFTVTLSTCCALRMRVSISAMGSLMLMFFLLPAGLGDAGDFPLHRHFTQFVAGQPKLAQEPARPTRYASAIAPAPRVGLAGKLLSLQPTLVTFFVGFRRVG